MERFWSKTKRNESNGCLEWCAFTTEYGRFFYNGRSWLAHRVAWVITKGPIPEGMVVCHKCDNPKCVDVEHLFIGTPQDNVNDREMKGRNVVPKGELCGTSKLTEHQVIEIRNSDLNLIQAAKQYGVTPQAIWMVRKRKNWAHVK